MSFWNQFKNWLRGAAAKVLPAIRRFMSGRYGVDQLSLHLLITGIVFYLVSLFTGSYALSLVSTALYIYTAWRMLSRNTARRAMENSRYMSFLYGTKQKGRQLLLRQKNRKEYKYFRCPKCRAILRLKRGSGTMHVTCGKCKHQFDQKA